MTDYTQSSNQRPQFQAGQEPRQQQLSGEQFSDRPQSQQQFQAETNQQGFGQQFSSENQRQQSLQQVQQQPGIERSQQQPQQSWHRQSQQPPQQMPQPSQQVQQSPQQMQHQPSQQIQQPPQEIQQPSQQIQQPPQQMQQPSQHSNQPSHQAQQQSPIQQPDPVYHHPQQSWGQTPPQYSSPQFSQQIPQQRLRQASQPPIGSQQPYQSTSPQQTSLQQAPPHQPPGQMTVSSAGQLASQPRQGAGQQTMWSSTNQPSPQQHTQAQHGRSSQAQGMELEPDLTSPQRESERSVNPSVDIYDSPEEVTVLADLPGCAAENVQVRTSNNTLYITGERSEEVDDEQQPVMHERARQIKRSIQLPTEVEVDEAEATCENGVCRVALPKKEEAKQREIGIH